MSEPIIIRTQEDAKTTEITFGASYIIDVWPDNFDSETHSDVLLEDYEKLAEKRDKIQAIVDAKFIKDRGEQ